MKPIILTTPKDQTLRISPYGLVGWGPKWIDIPGGKHRGSFVVLANSETPRDVLETAAEIDRLFELATNSPGGAWAGPTGTKAALLAAQEEAQQLDAVAPPGNGYGAG